MKKYFAIMILLFVVFSNIAIGQTKIKGVIKDKDNKALALAAILNKQTNKGVFTDANGKFEIEASTNDILSVSLVGYSTSEITISDEKANLEIRLINSASDYVTVSASSLSPKSYWLGATIAYNIDGAEVDNVVGSAKIGINPVKEQYLKADWGIVGNFANFISAQNKDKMDKDLTKLIQSAQGLSIAIAATWEILPKVKDFNFRCFFTSGYRLNAFQKVGKDSISVGLNQFRNTTGLELEGFEFKNGGKLHFSFEGSISFFSSTKYELVFDEKKSSLTGFEATVILPLAANIGFLGSGTYAKNLAPVYQFGIIFKDLK